MENQLNNENLQKISKKSKENISISLPKDILAKLEIISNGSPTGSGGKSGTIAFILKDFFDNDKYIKDALEIDSNAMLVPVRLYQEVEEISTIGFKGQLKKNKIKTISLPNGEFVVIEGNSYKNLYHKFATLTNIVTNSNINSLEMCDKILELEDKISKFEERMFVLESLNKV